MSLPTPRRVNRGASRAEPARTPPRRLARASSSKPVSRFTTPVRVQDKDRLQPILDDVSQASLGDVNMDVDELHPQGDRGPRPDTIFTKSKEFTVSFHSHLPEEVRQLLRNADFFRGSYSGGVDPVTEFSLVATGQTCYAWQHTQALTGIPTCYIFPCPSDRTSRSAPLHAFVPYSSVREPGLILMASSGEVRFWDNIGVGLAGGDHFFKAVLDTRPGETVTSLVRSDPQTYVASTSEGSLYRLTLTSTGGKYHLASRRFSRPQSLSLSRFFPLWAAQSLQPESGNISAISLGESSPSGREVWTLVDKHVQQWNMAPEGWEMLTRQDNVREAIASAILKSFNVPSDTNLDLELLDMAYEKPNAMASLSSSLRGDFGSSSSRRSGHLDVLVSHMPIADAQDTSMADVPRRLYVIVQLNILVDSLQVERLVSVPYQSTFGSSQPPVAPRLQLLLDGLLFVVQFGDAVTICARDNDYKDRIALKSLEDRTLGIGIVDAHSELLILSATTLMKVVVDYDEVSAFDYEHGGSGLIKAIMTQAILYGSYPGNPLHFGFPPEVDGESLMSGAEMLSTAILESDLELVADSSDITSQIATRKERLSFLIKFINENGVLWNISQKCRQKLAVDAERLFAAQQLWFRFEEFLSRRYRQSVLSDSITEYMAKIGEAHFDDPVRAFFRLHVADIGRLIPYIYEHTIRFLERMPNAQDTALSEAATVVLTILSCALEYREYNKGVYGLEPPMFDAWTSGDYITNPLLKIYEETSIFAEKVGDTTEDKELRSRIPQFASVIFAIFTERIEYLSSIASSDPKIELARVNRQRLFDDLRPTVLLVDLVKHGFQSEAFQLAEKHLDYTNLAALCNNGVVYPPSENPHSKRIAEYVKRFREPFVNELFQWYIENAELRTLFAEETIGEEFLDRFLTKDCFPMISWIQDLKKERFALAADALLEESQRTSNVAVKQVMLSIGRLSCLAEEQDGVEEDRIKLDALQDALSFVDVQQEILEDFYSVLESVHSRYSIERQVEHIAQAKASRLSSTRAHHAVFRQIAKKILLGKVLTVEELADVLSLMDNNEEDKHSGKIGISNYAIALHLLSQARDLPPARLDAAFGAVWRRIYLHDDWEELRRTAGRSDVDSIIRFEESAMFRVLQETLIKRHNPPNYVCSPSHAADLISPAAMAARHAGVAPDLLDALAADAQDEADTVRGYGLDQDFERAQQLVLQEMGFL